MRIHTLECELIASRNLDATFRFFEDPRNLARITPPGMGFQIVSDDHKMREGLEIEYRVRVFGLPLRWRSVISKYNPPFVFVDEAVKSPYALWRHRHTFRQTEKGTSVSDHVEYALPFSPVGEIGHFAVARQLRQIFRYRQKALAKHLGGRLTEVRPP